MELFEWVQMLDLVDKDFEAVVINKGSNKNHT